MSESALSLGSFFSKLGIGKTPAPKASIGVDDETTRLNVLREALTRSNPSTEYGNIRGQYYKLTSEKPTINACMVELLRYLRNTAPTIENQAARKGIIQDIIRANPGKDIETIFNEACVKRYEYVCGKRPLSEMDEPLILPRISSTLHLWPAFLSILEKQAKSSENPELQKLYVKIHDYQMLNIADIKLVLTTLRRIPQPPITASEVLAKIEELTLLSPEQIIAFGKK